MKIRKKHRRALAKAARLAGTAGGLIAIDALGRVGARLVSKGLKRLRKRRGRAKKR